MPQKYVWQTEYEDLTGTSTYFYAPAINKYFAKFPEEDFALPVHKKDIPLEVLEYFKELFQEEWYVNPIEEEE